MLYIAEKFSQCMPCRPAPATILHDSDKPPARRVRDEICGDGKMSAAGIESIRWSSRPLAWLALLN